MLTSEEIICTLRNAARKKKNTEELGTYRGTYRFLLRAIQKLNELPYLVPYTVKHTHTRTHVMDETPSDTLPSVYRHVSVDSLLFSFLFFFFYLYLFYLTSDERIVSSSRYTYNYSENK